MVGRPKINIPKEKIIEAIDNNKLLKHAAKALKVSYPTFLVLCEEHGIETKKSEDNYDFDWLYDILGLDKEGKNQNEEESIQLNVVRMKVPNHTNHVKVVLLGDVHYGHNDCNKEYFAKVLTWLFVNKEVYVIIMGDMVETSIKDSRGLFDQENFSNSQIYKMIEMLRPIADEGRLLGMHIGNHEQRIKNSTGLDITELMALMLKVPYFKYGVAHKFILTQGEKEEIYTMYTTHGKSRAQYSHTKMNACLKLPSIVDDAEVYAMGHVHELGNHKTNPYHIGDSMDKLTRYEKIFVLTGSYLKYWGTYAQQSSYAPSGGTGSPKLKFHIDEHMIRVST